MKSGFYKFILIMLSCLVLAENTKVFANEKNISVEDELLKTDYLKHVQVIPTNNKNVQITDELLNPDLYEDVPFRLSAYTNKYKNQSIKDELLEDSIFKENSEKSLLSNKIVPDEFFIEKGIDLTKVRKISSKNKYDFTKTIVPIQIKIAEHLKSTRQIIEGATIPFVAQHDFEINGKKFNSGTQILGRVETISESDKMGTPESIKISNFYIPEKEEINLYGSISKNGANRALWVYPLYQAGNICFYVAGFVFVPIHGGRAKLLTSESFTVFYETQ